MDSSEAYIMMIEMTAAVLTLKEMDKQTIRLDELKKRLTDDTSKNDE